MYIILIVLTYLVIPNINVDAKSYCLVKNYKFSEIEKSDQIQSNGSVTQPSNPNCDVETELIEYDPVADVCQHVMPNGTATIPVFIVTIKNDTISIDKSFYTVCRNGGSGILSWIKWNTYNEHFGHLEVFEGHTFVGRNKLPATDLKVSTDILSNTTTTPLHKSTSDSSTSFAYDYCIADLPTGSCLSILHKSVKSVITNDTEILIEKLPIYYELHFVEFSKWKNSTFVHKTTLAHATLYNLKTFTKYEEEEIEYGYVTENIIEYPKYFVRRTPVFVYFENGKTETHFVGTGKYTTVNGTITAIQRIPALQSIDATVQANIIKEVTVINAELIVVYDRVRDPTTDIGYAFKSNNILTTVNDIKIVYDKFIDIEFTKTPPTTTLTASTSQTTSENVYIEDDPDYDTITERTTPKVETTIPPKKSGSVYPGFRPIAIVSGIIIFAVIFIVTADVSRKLLATRRRKQRERRRETKFIFVDEHK